MQSLRSLTRWLSSRVHGMGGSMRWPLRFREIVPGTREVTMGTLALGKTRGLTLLDPFETAKAQVGAGEFDVILPLTDAT